MRFADDGKFHMWASEMTESTGIKSWITNSQIVHAVADDPQKPFQFLHQEVVWPVFSHRSSVTRSLTGEDVTFFYLESWQR